jgi:hypothetical protein
MAIQSSAEKRVYTNGIYEFVIKNFPNYVEGKQRLKDGLYRSLYKHKYFVKVPCYKNDQDKENYWILDQSSSSVFSNSSEKIMNLSKNAVRKNDTKRPNAYANLFSKK